MFPPSFRTQNIQTDGAVIHVRVGGSGPAVMMLHGFGDTGDMWAPLAAKLAGDRTVVVPDLRGMGLSSHPEGGYEKKTQARDVARVLDKLKIDKADLVTHDIGNMVGYALCRPISRTASPGGSSWMRLFRVSAHGTRSSEAPRCGISISADRTSSGWSKAGSASTSIASGTSCRPIRNRSTKPHAATTPSSMRDPARCIPLSTNSRPFRRTRSTTRRLRSVSLRRA